MIDHLSSSQINLYMQCGLKYKFQYIDKLPKPFRSSGLAFGSAIHAALAWFHSRLMKGKSDISLETLHRIFDADWYAQKLDTEIRYKDGEEEMKLAVLGKEMLRLYFNDPFREIQGNEVPFVIPIVDPASGKELDITLEGFFDLIENDGTIVEFKTSAQAYSPSDVEQHLQLTVYSYAYQVLYRKMPKLLKIVDFVKNKKPRILVLETQRTHIDHQRFYSLVLQVLEGIRNQIFFPRPGFMCKDCEYLENCKAWGLNVNM